MAFIKTKDGGIKYAKLTPQKAIKLFCAKCGGRDCIQVFCELYTFRNKLSAPREGESKTQQLRKQIRRIF